MSKTCHFSYTYDPKIWDGLDSNLIDLFVERGPKRDNYITKDSKDKFSWRFTDNLYTRVLSNKEKCDIYWLVYSKEFDRIRDKHISCQ